MLFHKDIRLPAGWKLPSVQVDLEWTKHAYRAAYTDRLGTVEPYPVLDLSCCETIEVELDGARVVKLVLRAKWNNRCDVVYVVIPNGRKPWTVKTVWLNLRSDTHQTLDRSRYVQ